MAYVISRLGDEHNFYWRFHFTGKQSIEHLCAIGQLIADFAGSEMRLSVDGITVETFIPLGERRRRKSWLS
jgi:hypothetical protein